MFSLPSGMCQQIISNSCVMVFNSPLSYALRQKYGFNCTTLSRNRVTSNDAQDLPSMLSTIRDSDIKPSMTYDERNKAYAYSYWEETTIMRTLFIRDDDQLTFNIHHAYKKRAG